MPIMVSATMRCHRGSVRGIGCGGCAGIIVVGAGHMRHCSYAGCAGIIVVGAGHMRRRYDVTGPLMVVGTGT